MQNPGCKPGGLGVHGVFFLAYLPAKVNDVKDN